jgi:hypothetical protein
VTGSSYLSVRWLHKSADYPVELWSELDEHRFETRKVEIYADGRVGYASKTERTGDTVLGEEAPVPQLTEIASDPEFEPEETSRADFEARWQTRLGESC